MMVSTKGRYALRVMIDLAEHQTDGYIPLKEIAKQLKLEDPSLEQLKQQAKDRAHAKNERNAKSPSRPKNRGELEL